MKPCCYSPLSKIINKQKHFLAQSIRIKSVGIFWQVIWTGASTVLICHLKANLE